MSSILPPKAAVMRRKSPSRLLLRALTAAVFVPLRGMSASPVSFQRPYSLLKSSRSSTSALKESMSMASGMGPGGSRDGSTSGRRIRRTTSAVTVVAWKRRPTRAQ